jgi:triosephosphate isomerase (TIM)
MKKLFIVANWKANKTSTEAAEWFRTINNSQFTFNTDEKEVIVCPPFTLLSTLQSYIEEHKLPFKVGGENISPFDEGAYTGEESAKQIKEFADYVILGHSERRKNFAETDAVIEQKVVKAREANLTPIFCVQGMDTPIPQGVKIVAYEPIGAIGTGHPDTPTDAEKVAKYIKEEKGVQFVLYGGSVTEENVNSFTQMPSIDGVLVGGASLDAEKFMQIVENA